LSVVFELLLDPLVVTPIVTGRSTSLLLLLP